MVPHIGHLKFSFLILSPLKNAKYTRFRSRINTKKLLFADLIRLYTHFMEMLITHLSPFWRFLVDFLSFLYYNRATGSQRSVLAMKKKTALTKMHIAPSTVCYDAVAARDSNEVGLILAAVRKRNGYSLVTFSELLRHYGVDVSESEEQMGKRLYHS